MKISLFSLILYCLSTFCLAQNWAPFLTNKKILYSTPDSIASLLVGKSLVLIQFDTSIANGSSITYYNRNLQPLLGLNFDAPFGAPKSYTSLYGSKMVYEYGFYRLYPQSGNFFNNPGNLDTIVYRPEAGLGSIILYSPQWKGVVTQKAQRIVNGQPDSVKIIQITETPGTSGQPNVYQAEVSKRNGFLSIPDLFTHYGYSRSVYDYFGDYDQDFLGIKTHRMKANPFQEGDVLVYSSSISFQTGFGDYYYSQDSVKSTVTSIQGDSCIVFDSVKSKGSNGIESIWVRTKKIKNEPLEYIDFSSSSDSLVARMDITSKINTWRVKVGFFTRDSILFTGILPANLGMNDGPFQFMVSTRLPLTSFFRSQFSGGQSMSPISFTRGNKTYGQHVNILFTPSKEILQRKVSVYPNPTSEKLKIEGIAEPTQIQLFSLQGKKILEENLSMDAELNVQKIPIGMYCLVVSTGNQKYCLKLAKE